MKKFLTLLGQAIGVGVASLGIGIITFFGLCLIFMMGYMFWDMSDTIYEKHRFAHSTEAAQARDLGRDSYIQGKKEYENPFSVSSPFYDLWEQGWVEASSKKILQDFSRDTPPPGGGR